MFINEYGDKNDPLFSYMAANPKEYAEEIEAFIWRKRDVLG